MEAPWGTCDRCGWRRRDTELRFEWTNARVCPECFDPRPPYLDPPFINPMEGAAIPDARPDVVATFTDDDDPVLPSDIKPDRRFS